MTGETNINNIMERSKAALYNCSEAVQQLIPYTFQQVYGIIIFDSEISHAMFVQICDNRQ